MPIVYCPACGQQALVLIGGSPQRTCSNCRQVFWTTPKQPRTGRPRESQGPSGGKVPQPS